MTMTRATINDVAQAAGVSKGAVSFALNGRPGISPETRARILEIAEELGWTPSPRARALSVSRALAVGLVVARAPEVLRADAFFPAFIAGLETVLSESGHALLLMVAEHDDMTAYRRLAQEGRVDGVVLTDLRVGDERPALLEELDLRFIAIGPASALEDGVTPGLGVDDKAGVRLVVDHLVGLGHRRIAHVAGPLDLVHGVSRRDAWREGLLAAGLAPTLEVTADFSAKGGARATHELLDLAEPPSAIVYASDVMAMAGLSVAHARGVRVPQDLSITGYDDIELAEHLQPPLTTVSVDVPQWGRAAATRLLEVVARARPTTPSVAPPRLVVRGSTGPLGVSRGGPDPDLTNQGT
jgi:DNA-binding LacI/PurR family transcriptional regulator